MPIYEYRCNKCGEFEVTQKITDKALSRCPTCKGKVTKLISNTSFQLKGGGWYATDYARSGSSKGKEASGSSDSSSSETKSESKGEASSEAKSEPKSKSESKSNSSERKSKHADAA